MDENNIETIRDDFFENIKEEKREKLILENIVDAQIVDVSEAKFSQKNGVGETKSHRAYHQYFFYVDYLIKKDGEERVVSEPYTFRVYDDTHTIWWGSENSACGLLVSKVRKYTPTFPKDNATFIDLKEALKDRKVKIITAEFGNSKTKKIMIDTFL